MRISCLLLKATDEDEGEKGFKWGVKMVVGQENCDVQYYKSFTYKGQSYSLYDSVYIYVEDDVETHVGKLLRMYETPNRKRMVKVLWFFRPIEIHSHLVGVDVMWNELFLASGLGKGLTNDFDAGKGLTKVIDAHSILGKCNVVCISKDKRNTQVSGIKSKDAVYIFYRTFDVRKLVISKELPDEIAGIKVEFLLNGVKGQTIAHPALPKQGEQINTPDMIKPNKDSDSPAKNTMPTSKKIVALKESEHRNSSENPKLKRFPVASGAQPGREIKDKSKVRFYEDSFPENTADTLPLKKRPKVLDGKGSLFQKEGPSKGNYVGEKAIRTSENAGPQIVSDRSLKTHEKFTEVTRRPDADRRNWFKQRPWEERLVKAQEAGSLVLLENLDPSYTSLEVEDIVWHALKEKVQARMIERITYSSPLNGKAYVIFKSQVAADTAIYELNRRCLVLGDGSNQGIEFARPVCARRRNLRVPSKETSFVGHLEIEELKLQNQRYEMRNAVSTAHCSQQNTIEYDLALQWIELQEKSDLQWKTLYEEQLKDINEVKSKFKLN